ncbi:unnamed protein product [Trichogramma brassicae]|uniref:Uncharacterized protein n=1 Tax=Trichogramma brassicae TaxID=86971 RepID=A0A6H5IR49_9HYME|nr:unnamed protein product [Trichogramma brassicae]
MATPERQEPLEKLKDLRDKVNWNIEEERCNFLVQLHQIFNVGAHDFETPFPKVQFFLRPEEIQRLLWDSINYKDKIMDYIPGDVFIGLAAVNGYKYEPEVDQNGIISPRRTTLIHRAVKTRKHIRSSLLPFIFEIYNRFDVNYTDESGYSHFHAACQFSCDEAVRQFLEAGQDPNCIWTETGDSALHLVLSSWEELNNHMMVVLLRAGADPNVANKEGLTPLHIVAKEDWDGDMLERFFQINDELNQLVQVDARDKLGNTSLHLLAAKGGLDGNLFEVLLRNGADPNAANNEGSTPLHNICKRNQHVDETTEFFFQINDELNQRVLVDARDKLGNTPLHLALECCGQKEKFEVLLRRGATPNSTNNEGSTPLHIICKRDESFDGFAEFFLKINDELNQWVLIDARDKLGRTPLQWAVMSCLPRSVETLLNHGADLSSFVLPTSNQFDKRFESIFRPDERIWFGLPCGLLAAIESLKKRGYKLDRSDAMMIMKLFDKYTFFELLEDFDKRWYDDEKLANEAREKIIKSDLSLYDLVHSRPQKVAKRLTYVDCYELAKSDDKACCRHACEMTSRKFFWSWALEPFWKLIHYRLPIEMCELILENMQNKDLYNICLAAEDQTDKDVKINVITNV